MVEKHGLKKYAYKEVSSWRFGDVVFSWEWDMFADTSKSRRFGFHEYVDTEAMFGKVIEDFRKRKIIPA